MIEEKHLAILSKHKHIYDLFIQTSELVNFTAEIQNEIVSVYKIENPHYHYNRTCPACVCDMIKTIYNWYNKKTNEIK